MNPVNSKVQMPVDLLSYVQENRLVKAFPVFLYLKCMTSGKVNDRDVAFTSMSDSIGVKDRRTLKKHINRLLALNWIGYNPKSGNYFIRSIGFIWKIHQFKSKTAATFKFKDIRSVQAFITGSILSNNVKRQQYVREVVKTGRAKSAINKSHVAPQDLSLSSKATNRTPTYYGVGVHKIAKLLFCSPTRACELKHEAEKAGFIKTKKKYKEICRFPNADYWRRNAYKAAYPESGNALRFKTGTRNKKKFVLMVEQLHDEIKPMVPFKRVRKLRRLSKPVQEQSGNPLQAKLRLRELQGE